MLPLNLAFSKPLSPELETAPSTSSGQPTTTEIPNEPAKEQIPTESATTNFSTNASTSAQPNTTSPSPQPIDMNNITQFEASSVYPAQPKHFAAKVTYNDDSYRLGVGDVMSYHVYRAEDLTQEGVLVRADGKATFNGIGEVDVLGKTIEEVDAILEQRLSALIRKPIVTLAVTQTKPGIVYLAGAVVSPGMYEFSTSAASPGSGGGVPGTSSAQNVLRSDFKLSNILANAGGVKMNADLGNVEVRSADGKDVIKVDLWDMLENGNSDQDLTLHSGDTVVVPELAEMALEDQQFERLLRSTVGPKTMPIRLVGSLNTPGLIELDGKSPYLNSAISKAGGFTPMANRTAVAIRRRMDNGQLATLYVNPSKMDMTLRPNDVVYVVDTNFNKMSEGANKVSKIFAPLSNFASIAFAVRYFTRQ